MPSGLRRNECHRKAMPSGVRRKDWKNRVTDGGMRRNEPQCNISMDGMRRNEFLRYRACGCLCFAQEDACAERERFADSCIGVRSTHGGTPYSEGIHSVASRHRLLYSSNPSVVPRSAFCCAHVIPSRRARDIIALTFIPSHQCMTNVFIPSSPRPYDIGFSCVEAAERPTAKEFLSSHFRRTP